MTLIKELIDIPEHIDKGQFVLRLTEGVTDAQATVDTYVPTEQLVKCFDDALSFIRGAMQSATSKATYLHGSFGSGKSHFMAILHLILHGNPVAKGIPELASTIQKHNDWGTGKKFLLVPYHMIAAHDVESGILGGYVDYIRRTHPDAPIPGVYLAEGLFRDAEAIRQKMGDGPFFEALNAGVDSGSGWGDLEDSWAAERYEAAVKAPPPPPGMDIKDLPEAQRHEFDERSQLIGLLMKTFFGSYDTQASDSGEKFLSLDRGLSVISKHAQSLGYDGLILFLDELILWLASHAADLNFVHQEGQKLAKLVEAQTPDRPIPIISFIARQRDLSELIGESVPGADRLNFGDALKHWEGRFHKITLEDRNLPAIAQKRVLKCKDDTSRTELDAAFERTAKIREAVMNTLLTSDGDREMFRKVYPFSPALVQTLIAVSSVLQRERTALKVMMQLLVDQRDILQVGDIVPVGDLFDVIAHGDEAFSQEMAIHFDNAKRLYHQKLLPMLEKQHGHRDELQKLPVDDPKRGSFRNDDRLVKTLLLSALVPEVETLRGLNAERLAALNHGTIKTPIAGREGQEVLRRCRTWAATVGEIRIGEEANPTISLQLSGVDTEGIIKQAEREDNQGNRVRRVRQMLFEQLGIEGEGEFEHYHDFMWKNTKRSCQVLFKNIRELSDPSFENSDDDAWKLIIDFPFDEAGHGPRDDIGKLQAFNDSHPNGVKTLCWVPQFFSEDARKDLGLLVILEHILTGERFSQYANHLSPQDRQGAKSLLENQRSILKQRVQNHLDAAYGLDAISSGSLDTTHELEQHEQFVSLWNGFDPQPPVAANLGGAMRHLLHQTLESEFPGAPEFEAEVKSANLKKVQAVLTEAAQASDGRVLVDKPLRPLMRQIANPLMLGEMGHDATHFVLGHHWRNHFQRKAAEAGGSLSVGQLRDWIDQPRAMGLPSEAQNLVIIAFAEQTNHTFLKHGAPWDGTLSNLPDDCELRQQKLPAEDVWNTAVTRAGSIFGETSSPLLKASNVSSLAAAVKKHAAEQLQTCSTYSGELKNRLTAFGLDETSADRLQTAVATHGLLAAIHGADVEEVIQKLASASIATTESAMGECLSKAGQLTGTITGANWEIFDAIGDLPADFQDRAKKILSSVNEALVSDEHVVSLGPALKEAQAKSLRLITEVTKPAGPGSQPDPKPEKPKTPKPVPGKRIVEQDSRQNLSVEAAQQQLQQLADAVDQGRQVRVSLSWVIEEQGGDA
ncbi:MAG: phage resistance protein [Planctomycetota bacterium]|jgi:hypothetical protein